jgi:sigma-54 specific flagellar transcriptional regulator A
MVDKVADSDSTILIQGESGTGKELIAEAIHKNSERADKPFVRVNCAAFVETLLLSELFGHEKGAFTGAMARKQGRFELADGGTLFLDEIGDISPNTQVSLLRVLQERTFERVGGSSPIHVDVRVIVATNRNLEEMVRRGDFRLDLYYRLKGVILDLPPLRERHQDIVRLLHHFVAEYGTPGRPQRFSREALRFLARYSWPGNVRELKNFTRSIILFVDDPVIELPHVLQFEEFFADGEIAETLPDEFDTIFESDGDTTEPAETDKPVRLDQVVDVEAHRESDEPAAEQTGFRNPEEALLAWAVQEGLGLPELRKRLDIECIKHALTETGGNITQAAQLLDMKRPRLSQIVNGDEELCELKQRLVTS